MTYTSSRVWVTQGEGGNQGRWSPSPTTSEGDTMRRKALSKRASKREFKKGTSYNSINVRLPPARGGHRL